MRKVSSPQPRLTRGLGVCAAAAAVWSLCLPGPAAAQSPPAFDVLTNPQTAPAPALPLPGVGTPRTPTGPSVPAGTFETLTGSRAGEAGREADPDEIETDRDSFTPATTTAGRRRLIFETAYSFVDNRGVKETHSLPELILRYGLTDRVELRLGWNYEVGGAGNETSGLDAGGDEEFAGGKLERSSQLNYGVKVKLTDQDRWRPQSAAILQAATPTGGETTATQLTATYVTGWTLPNRWKFDAAFRYQYATETGDRHNVWAPSAVLKVPFGERWDVHAEYFGVFSNAKAENFTRHYFSPGAHYLVTSDLEVGVRVGWGLNDQTSKFFTNVGVGWRY